MPQKHHKKRHNPQQHEHEQSHQLQLPGSKQIQRMIKPKIHLWLQSPCKCPVCTQQKPIINREQQNIREYRQSSKKSHQWLKKILVGLTQKITKGLKLFVPDILFLVGDGLEIYSTNKKDYRVIKFAGTTPLKAIVGTMTRLRKQYKGMLQQSYRKTMIDKINPNFMHVKYFDRLLPSHFHDGFQSKTLTLNKSKFKTYILNSSDKYIISSIEEHKMNDKEPFATIRYTQGNFQLLNQKQFQLFSLMKIPDDVVYVQSFIKSREAEAIVISTYSENTPGEIDSELWKRAELYVMVLTGGLGRYDQGYDQLENFQDETEQMMKSDPSTCAKLMTYQIIHFLSMASKVYIRHIKIKWIINDIDNLYLQEIIEFETEEISKRLIRYKLAPTVEIHNFYKDGDFFIQIHNEMKKKKEENIVKVKKQLEEQNYLETIDKREDSNSLENSQSIMNSQSIRNSQTIGNSQSIRNSTIYQKNPIIQKRNSLTDSKPFNPQTPRSSRLKNNIYRRLTLNSNRNISKIQDSLIYQPNKISMDTKDSTILQSSQKFNTIIERRSFSQNRGKVAEEERRSQEKTGRSISGFGDVITRYQQRMIDRERRGGNKSGNRYQGRRESNSKVNPFDLQMIKTTSKRYNATIDLL